MKRNIQYMDLRALPNTPAIMARELARLSNIIPKYLNRSTHSKAKEPNAVSWEG
jgi:hypothetical protein